MNKWGIGLAAALIASLAMAKLPPPGEEAAAKAAEAKDKAGWADKVNGYKLCLVQDKLAVTYRKKGVAAPAPGTFPACTDPGPYVAALPAVAAAPAAAPSAAPAAAPAAKK